MVPFSFSIVTRMIIIIKLFSAKSKLPSLHAHWTAYSRTLREQSNCP